MDNQNRPLKKRKQKQNRWNRVISFKKLKGFNWPKTRKLKKYKKLFFFSSELQGKEGRYINNNKLTHNSTEHAPRER